MSRINQLQQEAISSTEVKVTSKQDNPPPEEEDQSSGKMSDQRKWHENEELINKLNDLIDECAAKESLNSKNQEMMTLLQSKLAHTQKKTEQDYLTIQELKQQLQSQETDKIELQMQNLALQDSIKMLESKLLEQEKHFTASLLVSPRILIPE